MYYCQPIPPTSNPLAATYIYTLCLAYLVPFIIIIIIIIIITIFFLTFWSNCPFKQPVAKFWLYSSLGCKNLVALGCQATVNCNTCSLQTGSLDTCAHTYCTCTLQIWNKLTTNLTLKSSLALSIINAITLFIAVMSSGRELKQVTLCREKKPSIRKKPM